VKNNKKCLPSYRQMTITTHQTVLQCFTPVANYLHQR